jgi:hypothetical protein
VSAGVATRVEKVRLGELLEELLWSYEQKQTAGRPNPTVRVDVRTGGARRVPDDPQSRRQ